MTLGPDSIRATQELMGAGRYEEALNRLVPLLTDGTAGQQWAGEAHVLYSVCLSRLERPAEALEAARRAAELAPLSVPAHFSLGVLLARAGRLLEARAALERVLELAPDHSHARRALAALGPGPSANSPVDAAVFARLEKEGIRELQRIADTRHLDRITAVFRRASVDEVFTAAAEALDSAGAARKRVLAAMAAGRWEDAAAEREAALEPLLVALKHGQADLRSCAEAGLKDALTRIGRGSPDALAAYLQHPEEMVRRLTAEVASETDELIRSESGPAGGDTGPPLTGDPADRETAAPTEELIRDLLSADPWARVRAGEALRRRQDPRTDQLLEQALGESGDDAVVWARSLSLCGREALDSLVLLLTHADPAVRQAAAETLGEMRDRRALAPLCAMLWRSKVRRGRITGGEEAAAEAVGKLGGLKAFRALTELIAERILCAAAVRGLAYLLREHAGTLGAAELSRIIGLGKVVETTWARQDGVRAVSGSVEVDTTPLKELARAELARRRDSLESRGLVAD